jgi:hypothetical protein
MTQRRKEEDKNKENTKEITLRRKETRRKERA